MARTSFAVQATSMAELSLKANLALLSYTSHKIKTAIFFAVHKERRTGSTYRLVIEVETGGAAQSAPFRVVGFDGGSHTASTAAFTAYVAANPALFITPPFSCFLPDDSGSYTNDSPVAGFTCTDAVNGASNWQVQGSGGGGGGVLAGDVTGPAATNTVEGIQGVPVDSTAPTAAATLIYNADTTQYEPAVPVQYFASGAAAQAAAPFINGTTVVVYPGTPTSEAGTYQVTSNGGAAFPADYTKVSDQTDTASEVGTVDAGNYYGATPKNVEAELQALGPIYAAGPATPLPADAPGVLTNDGLGGLSWGAGAPPPIPTGHTTWVDAVNGDDDTGTYGRQDLPFETLEAASAVGFVDSSDTIRVRPGPYFPVTALRPGLWYFEAGAGVVWDETTPMFDAGVFVYGDGVFTVKYLTHLTDGGSDNYFECDKLYALDNAAGCITMAGAGVGSGPRLTLKVKQEFLGYNAATPFIDATEITKLVIHINRITTSSGSYFITATGDVDPVMTLSFGDGAGPGGVITLTDFPSFSISGVNVSSVVAIDSTGTVMAGSGSLEVSGTSSVRFNFANDCGSLVTGVGSFLGGYASHAAIIDNEGTLELVTPACAGPITNTGTLSLSMGVMAGLMSMTAGNATLDVARLECSVGTIFTHTDGNAVIKIGQITGTDSQLLDMEAGTLNLEFTEFDAGTAAAIDIAGGEANLRFNRVTSNAAAGPTINIAGASVLIDAGDSSSATITSESGAAIAASDCNLTLHGSGWIAGASATGTITADDAAVVDIDGGFIIAVSGDGPIFNIAGESEVSARFTKAGNAAIATITEESWVTIAVTDAVYGECSVSGTSKVHLEAKQFFGSFVVDDSVATLRNTFMDSGADPCFAGSGSVAVAFNVFNSILKSSAANSITSGIADTPVFVVGSAASTAPDANCVEKIESLSVSADVDSMTF